MEAIMAENGLSDTESYTRSSMEAGPLYATKINTSGLEPRGRAVLIKPYKAERLSNTIAIPDSVKTGLEMVEQRAIVIAVGRSAWHDEPHKRAVAGEHVLVTKYAGFEARGEITADGQTYRLVNDRDIFCAIVNHGEAHV